MIENNYCFTNIEEKNKIRECFNVDDFTIKRDIEIIKNWIKQQLHLPQNSEDNDFFEKCLLKNKFSIEKTKERLEKYYTVRRTYLDLFEGIPVPLPSKTNLVLPLPTLTDKLERVIILQAKNDFPDDEDYIIKFFKYSMYYSEYCLRSDYSIGQRIIQDCQGLTLEQLKKYTIGLVKYGRVLECYFVRCAGIEYLNAPPFADAVLRGIKSAFGEKIFSKITIHKDLESLHKNVNKTFLPKEFGGDLKPMSEYIEMWDKEFENNLKVLEKIFLQEVSNENLRIGKVKHNEFFGVEGSFKNLRVD